MKRITKSSLIFVMAIFAMITCILGVNFASVNANENTEVALTEIALTVDEGASVRIGLKREGETQVATDYTENGIRFTLRMNAENHEKLADRSVVFGALVLPLDYIETYGAVTTASVFGEVEDVNTVYTIKDAQGKIKIANVETKELVEDKDGSFYYNVSMVNLKANNKDREFIAVPYLKETNDLGETNYDVKAYDEENARSMAYVAQKEIEKSGVDSLIVNALKENYINGLTEEVNVNVEYGYATLDGAGQGTTLPLTFDLGEEITLEKIRDLLENENELYNSEYHVFDSENSQIKVNGVAADKAIVYANGKTNAEITVRFNVAEVDANVYNKLAGYYTTENFGSIVLNGDNTAAYNKDLGVDGGVQNASYKLYKDGNMILTLNGNNYSGFYVDSPIGAVCQIQINDEIHAYMNAVEVPASVYNKLRGYYVSEGGDSFAVVNNDGTILVDLEKQGSYAVSYSTEEQDFVVTTAILGESNDGAAIDLAKDSITIDGVVYNKSTEKTLASEEQYAAFAKTYTGEVSWSTLWGRGNDFSEIVYKKGSTEEVDVKRPVSITFTADGGLYYESPEEYVAFGVGAWLPTGLMKSVKNGNFVLFSDGTISARIADVVKLKNNNYSYDDVNVTGAYTEADKKLALTIPGYRQWTDTINLTQQAAVSVDMDALYNELCFDSTGKRIQYLADPGKVIWTNPGNAATQLLFYTGENPEDKYFEILDGYGTHTKTYTIEPITETYGLINVPLTNGVFNVWKCYYSYVDGLFTLHLTSSFHRGGVNVTPGYNHFVDFYPGWSNDYTSNHATRQFRYKIVMDKLAGAGGTVENPVSTTYSSEMASLTLYNDGVHKVETEAGHTGIETNKAVVNFGDKDINATYSVVALTNTKGLIFIDLAEKPRYEDYNNLPEGRYIEGEYQLINGKYVITFNYEDQDFALADGGMENMHAAQIVGTYSNGTDEITLNDDGTVTYGGADCQWMIASESATSGMFAMLIGQEDVVMGSFSIANGNVKLIVDGKLYFKALGTTADLYAKYAGTYTATYDSTQTLQLVLGTDGSVKATGSEIKGTTERLGTYSFEIIEGELNVVFDFDVFDSSNTMGTNCGYYSSQYSRYESGSSLTNKGLPTQWTDMAYNQGVYSVYNYAFGSVTADGFSVMFTGLSTSAINLVKTAA